MRRLSAQTATVLEAHRALHAVIAGELWASRLMLSNIVRNVLREFKHRLTHRESEILSLVSEGLKNREIAERLFVSPDTVRWHLRCLYSKLGTHDRLRAILRAPLFDAESAPVNSPHPVHGDPRHRPVQRQNVMP